MSKSYTFEFKLKVVMEYLNGEGGYMFLSKKYNITNKSSIRIWVNSYIQFGVEGLRKKMKNNQYSSEFKLSVLKYRKLHELSYRETANHFNINNPSMLVNWQRKFDKEGLAGLENKKRGRPRKDMSDDKTIDKQHEKVNEHTPDDPLSESERQELKRLREENEYLRMSLEVEKKLQALVREKKLKAKKNQK